MYICFMLHVIRVQNGQEETRCFWESMRCSLGRLVAKGDAGQEAEELRPVAWSGMGS